MTLVLVSCGAAKRTVPCQARTLYTGSFFSAGLAWARSVAEADDIRILSALHGLVPLDRVLDPYNLRMGEPGSITTDALRVQAQEAGLLDADPVVIVGGMLYVKVARGVWSHAVAPFGKEGGVTGIGYSIQRLNMMRGRMP